MPFVDMSKFNTDQETGGHGDAPTLQACRQAYFLKQQNQILKQGEQTAIVSPVK
jgi:hypothetical protein